MRGEPAAVIADVRLAGITPAYAGRTGLQGFPEGPCQDHPRVCGENSTSGFVVLLALGSPPRMRGELSGSRSRIDVFGITPAYAGRTRPF